MNIERKNQIDKIMKNQDKNIAYTNAGNLEGILMNVPKDSKEAKELEESGFMIIYSKDLTEEQKANLTEEQKVSYEKNFKDDAILIDKNDKNDLSASFAVSIYRHYFRMEKMFMQKRHEFPIGDRNSISIMELDSDKQELIAESSDKEQLKNIYDQLGYDTEVNEKELIVNSKIELPIIKKSKYEKAYEKMKNALKGLVGKLKSIGKQKDDKTKENDEGFEK